MPSTQMRVIPLDIFWPSRSAQGHQQDANRRLACRGQARTVCYGRFSQNSECFFFRHFNLS